MTFRYTFLGDRLTDDALRGKRCNPVRRPDGRCVVSQRMATQLVLLEGETQPRVVPRRRLRLSCDLKVLADWEQAL